jgi:hypothetical protein
VKAGLSGPASIGWFTRRVGVPAFATLLILVPPFAPEPLPAQEPRGTELGVIGMVALSEPAFVGGGLQLAVRPGGRARIAVSGLPGAIERRFALRGEVLAQFLLNPAAMRGVGVYGLAGIAGVTGPNERAYLVAGIGLEANPGGRSGWLAEAGIGGGARLVVGWRRRWFARPRQPAP